LLRAELLCMSARTYNVRLLCTGNSARSIVAQCLLREPGKGTFQAYSAGSFPKGAVHPLVLRLLNERDFSTEHLRSKPSNEFAAPGAPVMRSATRLPATCVSCGLVIPPQRIAASPIEPRRPAPKAIACVPFGTLSTC
jgi:hypothetical protein